MMDNARAEVRPSATKRQEAEPDSYTRIKETRQLLSKALTALDAGEQQTALDALAAATNRLGDRTYSDQHPAGDALDYANRAIDAAMIDTEPKRKDAAYAIREALQFLVAAEEYGEETEQDDEEVDNLLTDGGADLVMACPHCDAAGLQRRQDLGRARARWYCNECCQPVADPIEREARTGGGYGPHAQALKEANPDVIGGAHR